MLGKKKEKKQLNIYNNRIIWIITYTVFSSLLTSIVLFYEFDNILFFIFRSLPVSYRETIIKVTLFDYVDILLIILYLVCILNTLNLLIIYFLLFFYNGLYIREQKILKVLSIITLLFIVLFYFTFNLHLSTLLELVDFSTNLPVLLGEYNVISTLYGFLIKYFVYIFYTVLLLLLSCSILFFFNNAIISLNRFLFYIAFFIPITTNYYTITTVCFFLFELIILSFYIKKVINKIE